MSQLNSLALSLFQNEKSTTDARIRQSAFNAAPRSTRDTELSGSGVERTKAGGAGFSQSPALAPRPSWDPPGTSPTRREPTEPGSSGSDTKPLSGSSSRVFQLFPMVHRLGEPCFISQPSAVYFPNEHKDSQTSGEKAFI